MAHSNPAVADAIAEQLLVELDTYQHLLAELPGRDWPAAIVCALAEQAERVYGCAQGLQRVAVSFTEFLITRAELSHALWSRNAGLPLEAAALAQVHDEHVLAVQGLQRACGRARSAAQANHAQSGHSGEGVESALRALARSRPQRH